MLPLPCTGDSLEEMGLGGKLVVFRCETDFNPLFPHMDACAAASAAILLLLPPALMLPFRGDMVRLTLLVFALDPIEELATLLLAHGNADSDSSDSASELAEVDRLRLPVRAWVSSERGGVDMPKPRAVDAPGGFLFDQKLDVSRSVMERVDWPNSRSYTGSIASFGRRDGRCA